MVAAAREHAAADTQAQELVAARNVADVLAYRAERTLDKVGGQLSKQGASGARSARFSTCGSALVGDDLAILRERSAALRTALLKTGERVYHEPVGQQEDDVEQPTADAAAAGQSDPTTGEPPTEGDR